MTRVILLAIFQRTLKDLRLVKQREDAIMFFESPEFRGLCAACGLDFTAVMREVERQMDKPVIRR